MQEILKSVTWPVKKRGSHGRLFLWSDDLAVVSSSSPPPEEGTIRSPLLETQLRLKRSHTGIDPALIHKPGRPEFDIPDFG